MVGKHDGRHRRSEATRERIIEAMKALIEEGNMSPTTEMIASRAGVSSRSVFFRFRDMTDLYLAMIDSVIADMLPKLPPIPSDGPLSERLQQFIERRAQSGERFRHFWRSGNAVFVQKPAIAARGEMIRSITRARIETAFGPELARLDKPSAKSLIDAIAAATDWEIWDMMRRFHALDEPGARAAMENLVAGALLLHGVTTRQELYPPPFDRMIA